ncbi:MAG: hypothetical protein IVW54_01775 [Candidatus Binataceae bacterium]|nr:hypothetical protein [Candidatus Binataceae bacterium]
MLFNGDTDILGQDLEYMCLLPGQFYDLTRRRRALEGERRLLFAVLEDAIVCYLKKRGSNKTRDLMLSHEAENWIRSDGGVGPFSYEAICDALEIEPARLRTALEQIARAEQVMNPATQPDFVNWKIQNFTSLEWSNSH